MKSIKNSIIVGAAALLGNVFIAHADVTPAPAPIQSGKQVMIAICTFVGYFFWFVLTLTTIMVIVAAFEYVTAGDDTEKTSKARRTLTYAAVGVAVALCALAFPQIVSTVVAPSAAGTIGGSCSG